MTRILSLNDDPETLKLLHCFMVRAGYDHLITTNSKEALEILQRGNIDLFTQDIMRPEVDGYELYLRLKADTRTAHIPVLFITTQSAYQLVAQIGREIDQYGDGYLGIPFSRQELLAAIQSILSIHTAAPRDGLFSGLYRHVFAF